VQFWMSTFLNSVNNAENISVSILPEKKMVVQNLTLVMSGTITVPLVWMIYFFVETVESTGRGEAAFPLRIISVKTVKENARRLAICNSEGNDGKGSREIG